MIGLSAALEFARSGKRVVVFERHRAMSEASWAAAGMLAARDPENPSALHPLAELSLNLYPQFLTEIKRLAGVDVPIRTRRTIQVSHPLPEGAAKLDRASLEEFAPGLGVETGLLSFFLLEEESLDPRDLARALPAAVRAADVTLLEETPVTTVARNGGHIEIGAGAESWRVEHFINCCGAWATALAGIPIGPRKGQMLAVEDRSPRPLTVVLRTPEIYLVPRGDGRIVIGATVEDAGFDKQVEAAAIDSLINRAAALWPSIRRARVIETWAGLRPATADELPVIDMCGPASWIAAGHFRNGILLAPGTARLLRQMVLKETGDEPFSVDLAHFRCGRFAALSVNT